MKRNPQVERELAKREILRLRQEMDLIKAFTIRQCQDVAMVEQSLKDGKMTPQKDQSNNGRYAVVYSDPKKWTSPLIDICGKHYDRGEAEARMEELLEGGKE